MEALATIGKQLELAQQSSEESSLAIASTPPLPAQYIARLGQWMKEAQAAKPNQQLPPGTSDMYLAKWQEMAATMGMDVFRLGLSRALDESDFFPAPDFIRERCVAEVQRIRGENYLNNLAAWRQQWESQKGQPEVLTDAEREAKQRIEQRVAAVRDRRKV